MISRSLTTNAHFDTVVVGAGIIGLSIAWELAQRGERIIVLDAGQAGRGSSWAGAGILPPSAPWDSKGRSLLDPYEQLRSLSHHLHPQWAQKLTEQTGIETGYQRSGGIYLARTAAESATLLANELWWEDHSIDFERLDQDNLAKLEPNISQASDAQMPFTSAWHLPDERQLRNPWQLKALIAACRQSGVVIRELAPVAELLSVGTAIRGVTIEGGQSVQAEKTCICSGAWARKLLELRSIPNGIMPVRGQMVLYDCKTPPIHHIVNEGNRYLVPRADGRLLAGSVEEEVGYHCETNEVALAQIRDWAESLLPMLSESKIEQQWAGLRPGSYDGLPYLGRVPQTENCFIAAGHFRSGLHLSCATAELMANLMLGAANPIDLSAFRLARG